MIKVYQIVPNDARTRTPPMPANNPKQPEVPDPDATDADRAAAFPFQSMWALSHMLTGAKDDMGIVQAMKNHRIAAERATERRVLEEAARKAERSCHDYANTIEPSINDDGSEAFGYGFDYACEVIAAAIRAMIKEEPK